MSMSTVNAMSMSTRTSMSMDVQGHGYEHKQKVLRSKAMQFHLALVIKKNNL
jgi:hypothetical protein